MIIKYINYIKERGKYTIITNSAILEANRLFNRTRDYIVLSVSLFLDKKFQNVLQKSWIYATILWYNVDEIKEGIANKNWLRKSFNRRTIFE